MFLMFRTQVYVYAYKCVSLNCSFNMFNETLEIKCITPDLVHTSSSFIRPHPVYTWPARSHITSTITSHSFTCNHLVHTTTSRSHDHTPFTHDPIQTCPTSSHNHSLVHMWSSSSHETISFWWPHPIHMTSWPSHSHVATQWIYHLFICGTVVMVLRKCLDSIMTSWHIWTKSIKGVENMRY